MYSSKLKSINDARLEKFLTMSDKHKKKGGPLDGAKRFNEALLPPCLTVLELHMKRANYISFMWRSCGSPNFEENPADNGWLFTEDRKHFTCQWDSKEFAPTDLNFESDSEDGPESDNDENQASSDEDDDFSDGTASDDDEI